MAELELKKGVNNIAIANAAAPIGVSGGQMNPITTGWPVGDNLARTLVLRFSGTVTATLNGGTLSVTDHQLARLISNLILGSNLHNNIIENGMDGLTLFRMLSIAQKADLFYADVPSSLSGASSAGQFELIYRIPLGSAKAARYWDTVVDLITAQAYIRMFYNGVNANTLGAISGGAAPVLQVTSLNIEASLEMSRGPFTNRKGQPAFKTVAPNYIPYYAIFPVQITGTKSQLPIYLPYGDRMYKRLFIFQRDSITLNELNNTIVGVNDQDRLSMKLNGLPIVDSVEWLLLQRQNKQEYSPATIPNGAAIIDFDKCITDAKVRGARLSNDLNLITPGQQTFELDIDVTNPGGSPYLYIGMECVRPLPDLAKRPEQMQPVVAQAKAASGAGQ